jgi:hypothetical protein
MMMIDHKILIRPHLQPPQTFSVSFSLCLSNEKNKIDDTVRLVRRKELFSNIDHIQGRDACDSNTANYLTTII